MPADSPRDLVVDRPGLVVPVRTDAAGLAGPTPMEARGSRWRRTSRGSYVPADVDADLVEQRIVEAAVVVVRFGGVTGWAALRWQGGFWFSGIARDGHTRLPVPLAVASEDFRPQPGIRQSAERLGPLELESKDGLTLTNAVRSVCFEARYAVDVREAVVMLDMAAYSDLVSIHEAGLFAAHLNGWTGIPQLRAAVPLADENSWSPEETRARLSWQLDAELPRPLCNTPVFDRAGRHIGTPDLLDPEAGMVGEYDGRLHLEGSQRRKDRERDERYRAMGLEVVTIMAGDHTRAGRARLAERLHATRSRCRFAAASARPWTIDLPPWWISTSRVEDRQALDAGERQRLLGLRLRLG